MRLDKLLSNMGIGSRKDVKTLVKNKLVVVNGEVVRDSGKKVDPEHDEVMVEGKDVKYRRFVYLMMNKAPGYISATTDSREKTVVDLLGEEMRHFEPFPVGRLDKDTEGLLLLTNDGVLAHQLVSPKKDVGKTYYARVEGRMTDADVAAFHDGVVLDDSYKTKSAKLEILKSGQVSEVLVTITEGKFHQVKRMFEAIGSKVIFLKRMRMGELVLDESLKPGAYRELTEEELAYCQSLKK